MAKLSGEVRRVYQDYENGKFHVDIVFNEGITVANELIDYLNKNTVIQAEVKKESRKRSLDSNSYCWALCTKIAEAVDSSKDEVYEEMIQRYGYIYEDENGCVTMTIPESRDISLYDGHWKFIKGNDKFKAYLKLKGSSEYTSKEMTHFVEMIVLEAKELGIETMTPNQIAEMNAKWGKNEISITTL